MVGLSVVLEGQKSNLELVSSHGRDGDRQQRLVVDSSTGKLARVVHHTSIPSSSPGPASTRNNDRFALTAVTYSYPGRDLGRFSHVRAPPVLFLDRCFLCKTKLLPSRDIYMYRWVFFLPVYLSSPGVSSSVEIFTLSTPSINTWSEKLHRKWTHDIFVTIFPLKTFWFFLSDGVKRGQGLLQRGVQVQADFHGRACWSGKEETLQHRLFLLRESVVVLRFFPFNFLFFQFSFYILRVSKRDEVNGEFGRLKEFLTYILRIRLVNLIIYRVWGPNFFYRVNN